MEHLVHLVQQLITQLQINLGGYMYTIEYGKVSSDKDSVYKNIKSVSIDKEDIMMMRYIDVFHGGDKNLFGLYLKFILSGKKNNSDYFTIMNNVNNKDIIASIITCDWLVDEKSIEYNEDVYLKRKTTYQDAIKSLKNSKKAHDERQCLLMKYFIDTIDKFIEKENEKVKVLKN